MNNQPETISSNASDASSQTPQLEQPSNTPQMSANALPSGQREASQQQQQQPLMSENALPVALRKAPQQHQQQPPMSGPQAACVPSWTSEQGQEWLERLKNYKLSSLIFFRETQLTGDAKADKKRIADNFHEDMQSLNDLTSEWVSVMKATPGSKSISDILKQMKNSVIKHVDNIRMVGKANSFGKLLAVLEEAHPNTPFCHRSHTGPGQTYMKTKIMECLDEGPFDSDNKAIINWFDNNLSTLPGLPRARIGKISRKLTKDWLMSRKTTVRVIKVAIAEALANHPFFTVPRINSSFNQHDRAAHGGQEGAGAENTDAGLLQAIPQPVLGRQQTRHARRMFVVDAKIQKKTIGSLEGWVAQLRTELDALRPADLRLSASISANEFSSVLVKCLYVAPELGDRRTFEQAMQLGTAGAARNGVRSDDTRQGVQPVQVPVPPHQRINSVLGKDIREAVRHCETHLDQ